MSAPIPLAELWPAKGWLADWREFADATMMAPAEFKLGVGLACVSAALGRGAWFRLGGWKRWHPHLWVLLMGSAGHKKSTPIATAARLVRSVRGPDTALTRRWTLEGLYRLLQRCPDPFWNAGEIAGFLGSARRDYMAGTRTELADLWDGEPWGRTLSKEAQPVEDPAVTAVASAREDDFAEQAGLADFSSGFLSRFLLLPASGRPAYVGPRGAPGYSDELAEALFGDLERGLREIALWHGGDHRVRFDDEAYEVFEAADRPWQEEAEKVPRELSGWAARRGIQTMKLAVLHAMSARAAPEVGAEDMAWGRAVVEASWAAVEAISLERVGLSLRARDRERALEKALSLAADTGAAPIRLLKDRLWRDFSRRDVAELIETWVEIGTIELGGLRGERGPRAEAYRLLNGRPAPANWSCAHIHHIHTQPAHGAPDA